MNQQANIFPRLPVLGDLFMNLLSQAFKLYPSNVITKASIHTLQRVGRTLDTESLLFNKVNNLIASIFGISDLDDINLLMVSDFVKFWYEDYRFCHSVKSPVTSILSCVGVNKDPHNTITNTVYNNEGYVRGWVM